MPSRSNPNVPSALKPKTARTLKTKRQNTQRLARSKANGTATPRTSQAIRKAAPISEKKARKLKTKKLHAQNRAVEEAIRAKEVEMKDVNIGTGEGKKSKEGNEGLQTLNVEMGEDMVIDQGLGLKDES